MVHNSSISTDSETTEDLLTDSSTKVYTPFVSSLTIFHHAYSSHAWKLSIIAREACHSLQSCTGCLKAGLKLEIFK